MTKRWDPWTDAERDTVRNLTSEGKSAAELARVLGRTVGATAQMRKKLQAYVAPEVCKACGATLAKNTVGRRRSYCDDACSQRYYSELYKRERAERRSNVRCDDCGDPIPDNGSVRRFCSRPCAQRSWDRVTRNTPKRRRQMAAASKRYNRKKAANASRV